LDQALCPTQQGEQDIKQFVLWAVLDGLLGDLHTATEFIEDAARFEMCHQRGQTGMGLNWVSNGVVD
jgi:hypothetical protein